MKCIFCLEEMIEGLLSDEHVFPRSIGGTFIIKNVCINCNSYLGAYVDSHLVNHQAVINSSHTYKIVNKDGIVHNPFENVSKFGDTDEKVKYEFDEKGNPIGLYRIPFVEFNKKTGKLNVKLDARDKDKLPDIINKIADRNKLSRLSEEIIKNNTFEGRIEKPTLKQKWFFDTLYYQRGILKIAYELSCYWLGDDYLNDKTGKIIKGFVLDNNLKEDFSMDYPMKGNINLIEENSIGNLLNFEPFYHLALLSTDRIRLTMYLRVLDTFECRIVISNDARKYKIKSDKFIAINPQTGIICDKIEYKVLTNNN